MPDTVYTDRSIPLPAGANVLLFTDGFTEARNRSGKLLWLDPMEKCLGYAAKHRQPVEHTKRALIALVEAYQQGVPPCDDQTFLLLAETPNAPQPPT